MNIMYIRLISVAIAKLNDKEEFHRKNSLKESLVRKHLVARPKKTKKKQHYVIHFFSFSYYQ